MDFPNLRPGCALFCVSVVLLVLVGALVSLTSMGLSDPYISATTLCYLVGVLAAAWRLRWSGVKDLLVRADGLEDYAKKSGERWQKTQPDVYFHWFRQPFCDWGFGLPKPAFKED